jgi:acetyltransferase-like isoleucine patch superfamily enzyme
MKRQLGILRELNLKTFYFNFKYLPFKQAIRFPVFLGHKVCLKKLSGKILFECPIKPGLVKIGFFDVGIFDSKVSRSIWEVSGTVIFRGNISIGFGTKICVGETGTLTIGDGVQISSECSIIAYHNIEIGKGCGISWETMIMDTDFHPIRNQDGKVINEPRPVSFGEHVWIGIRCIILKGAKIPDHCIIGAGSLVSKPLEKENCIYAGNPAKIVKEDISWKF